MTDINKYRATPESFSDGQESREDAVDAVGNKKATLATALDDVNDAVKAYPDGYSYKYQAAAAANVVVKATPGHLHAIVVGKDVAGGIIEVSDHASDGDGNVQVYLEDPAVGTYIVDAYFATGICVDQTTQTNITYIYR